MFHRGALGDSVLVWPLLRALGARYSAVTFVTDASKAALAARVVGGLVRGVSAERPEFGALWRGDAVGVIDGGAGLVVHLAGRRGGDGGNTAIERWCAGARRGFPRARVEVADDVLDRRGAAALAERYGGSPFTDEWLMGAEGDRSDAGCVVLHVGAGSAAKRWDLERWAEVARIVRGPGEVVRVLAGEVEEERFGAGEREVFAGMGGEFVRTLEQLEKAVRGARAFVGCDSGPGHVAAQLGVPTLSLFGPTDPDAWAPIGWRVRVVAPEKITACMGWLDVSVVVDGLARLTG